MVTGRHGNAGCRDHASWSRERQPEVSMIRRTVRSGLLAAVAVLAFLPTAAGAAPAGATAPQPVPAATAQHTLPSLLPARQLPVRHHTTHRVHRARHQVAG